MYFLAGSCDTVIVWLTVICVITLFDALRLSCNVRSTDVRPTDETECISSDIE